MAEPVWPDGPPVSSESADPSVTKRTEAFLHRQAKRPSSAVAKSHFWTRWLHVYLSLFSFVIVLFFGITGITLNHPSWTFGDEPVTESATGVLPDSVLADDGSIEFLLVSEFVRAEHDVAGEVTDFGETQGEGTISYKAPAYGAEVSFDTDTLDYSVTVQQQGFVAAMNDLHKGRDTNSMWRWVIDLSGGLLAVVGLSGLGIQFFMRKRRRTGLTLAAIGGVVAIALIWLSLA